MGVGDECKKRKKVQEFVLKGGRRRRMGGGVYEGNRSKEGRGQLGAGDGR